MHMHDPPDALVGRVIAGRYRVQHKLEQGGMGAIYVALQEPLNRLVAIKLLRHEYASDVTALGRFEKEARAASALAHPHIVTVFDFGQTDDGQLYLAMEYLKGRSLRRLLDDEQRVAWRRSVHIVRGIVSGLVEAHRQGIMHRDLKPENVMLVTAGDDDDFVKILDFGLARSVLSEKEDQRLTQQNMIPGTPNYMPPERVNGVNDDLRSDLYSLGGVWFELLTGHIPFEDDNAVRILVRHLQDPPPRPSNVGADPELPRALDDLVVRLLAKTPDERPRSAEALLKEIARLESSDGWTVASARQFASDALESPSLEGWAGEPSLDFQFSPAVDEKPIELTKRKGAHASASPVPVDSSDAAVVLLTKKKGPAPPPRRPISSVADAATLLAQARNIDEVGATTVDFLRARFDRAALVDLRVRPIRAVDAWGLAGKVQLEGAIAQFQPLWDSVSSGEAYYGAPRAGGDWRELHRALSGHMPGGVLIAALRRNRRPALLVYAEHERTTLDADLNELGRLLKELAATLTTLRF